MNKLVFSVPDHKGIWEQHMQENGLKYLVKIGDEFEDFCKMKVESIALYEEYIENYNEVFQTIEINLMYQNKKIPLFEIDHAWIHPDGVLKAATMQIGGYRNQYLDLEGGIRLEKFLKDEFGIDVYYDKEEFSGNFFRWEIIVSMFESLIHEIKKEYIGSSGQCMSA